MFRKHSNRGMLFIFPTEKNVEIWMKNTFWADIIFISKERLIVGLVKKALPLSSKIYSITKKSKYVLEVNGGIIDRYNINLGDKIKISIKKESIIKIRIQLKRNFYVGPGKVLLLEKINETGSISKAAESMGLSYRKAWRLVNELKSIQ